MFVHKCSSTEIQQNEEKKKTTNNILNTPNAAKKKEGMARTVRVVVAFFGAFVAVARAIVVLTREAGRVAIGVLCAPKQALVALAPLAALIIRVALLAPKSNVRVAIGAIAVSRRVGNAVGRGAVAEEVVTRVLHDDFAATIVVALATRVLIRPLNVHLRTLVVVHGADIVAAAVIVLRIKHTVGVGAVARSLVEAVIGTAGAVGHGKQRGRFFLGGGKKLREGIRTEEGFRQKKKGREPKTIF